jgi:hypothetical protein
VSTRLFTLAKDKAKEKIELGLGFASIHEQAKAMGDWGRAQEQQQAQQQ